MTDLLNPLRQEMHQFVRVPSVHEQAHNVRAVLFDLHVAVAQQLHGLRGALPIIA